MLKGAHTSFNHVFVQLGIAFLPQLERCTILLSVKQLPNLQAFFMDIHHDTSFGYIQEDDSISSTSKAHIYFCLNKKVGLQLIIRPSIHLFHITHSTFTSKLCFRLNLIQPSTSSLFMCECQHGLNTSGMHLACCPFKGQRITTHNTIKDVMYALIQKSGHVVWKEQRYTFASGVSL